MNLNIGLVQCDIVWENTAVNLGLIGNVLNEIKPDVDLIVLPELFHCGFTMKTQENAQGDNEEVLIWMQQWATDLGATLMGSVAVGSGSGYTNRLYIVSSKKVYWYDKRHLFSMGGEHQNYQAGNRRIIVKVKGWKICPLICYDLRFPVWSRNDCNYDMLIYVANWPAVRSDVWNTLLKARAIENQSYVVAVNRVGQDTSNSYQGESQVVDAKGKQLIKLNDKAQVAYVSLDKQILEDFRLRFPVLNDRDMFSVNNCL